jgi:hypothetical protein
MYVLMLQASRLSAARRHSNRKSEVAREESAGLNQPAQQQLATTTSKLYLNHV